MVSVQLHNILMHVFHVFLYITLILGTYAFILDKIRGDNYQTENYQDQQPVTQGMFAGVVPGPKPQISKVDEVDADIKKIVKILKKFKTKCKTNCKNEQTKIKRLQYEITSKNLKLKPLREENKGLREENKGLKEENKGLSDENKELKKRPASCPAQGQAAQGQSAQGQEPVMEIVSQGDGYDSNTHLKIDSTKCKEIYDNFNTTFTKTWYPATTIQPYQTVLAHGCIMRSNPTKKTLEMGYNSYGTNFPANYVTCGTHSFKCMKQKKQN